MVEFNQDQNQDSESDDMPTDWVAWLGGAMVVGLFVLFIWFFFFFAQGK
jgi:hypothetical protein